MSPPSAARSRAPRSAPTSVANAANNRDTARTYEHCENVPSQARPDYWDVTYDFRGVEHRMQMTAPPGPTVTVNEQGEPRG